MPDVLGEVLTWLTYQGPAGWAVLNAPVVIGNALLRAVGVL